MSTRAQKIARLRNKKYRDAFVASQISVGLPFQIRALREQRGWKQSRLASETGMLQPRISAMESPGGTKYNLETLRRLASALDVALVVRFASLGELVDWSERFNPDTFTVPSFADDPAFKDQPKEPEKVVAANAQPGTLLQLAVREAENSLAAGLYGCAQPGFSHLSTPKEAGGLPSVSLPKVLGQDRALEWEWARRILDPTFELTKTGEENGIFRQSMALGIAASVANVISIDRGRKKIPDLNKRSRALRRRAG